MAVHHYAYSFDSESFHTHLQRETAYNGQLDLKQLQDLAISIVGNASEQLKRTLINIRMDNEWLDNPDKDESQAYLWYTICLADVLNECPSLSNNRLKASHFILEKVLPLAEWEENEVRELILGNRLRTLFTRKEDLTFFDQLTVYGGVISERDIEAILLHLQVSFKYVSQKTEEMEQTVKDYASYNSLQASQVLKMAYDDAIDMLETASKRQEALYLLRDA